ncbi:MAG TPA: hypothetical protein VF990_07820 [Candidatus Dormibacteraeota bacterium]
MKNLVAVMAAALYLAACGAPASIAASNVKSVVTVAGPDATEVAAGATRSPAATGVSHPLTPIGHSANPVPVTPASKPAAPPPAVDGGTPHLNCERFSGPGRPKVMCAPQ